MKINPYSVWQIVRAILLVIFVVFLFPLPFVLIGGSSSTLIVYLSFIALIIVGICIASVFCTNYKQFKPAPNKKAERIYGIVGITLILVAFGAFFIAPAIISSMQ